MILTPPSVGDRFTIKGIEFEVCFANFDTVRYAMVSGGQMANMPLPKFRQLIPCTEDPHSTRSIAPRNQTDEDTASMNRVLHYVRGVMKLTHYPRSQKHIKPLIPDLAATLDDENPPGSSTIARWVKNHIQSDGNPICSVPRTRDRGYRRNYFDPIVENIIHTTIYKHKLTEQRLSDKDTHAIIVKNILDEFANNDTLPDGLLIPSERTINRRIADIDPYRKIKSRYGKYIADKKFKAAGKSLEATRILEYVEADGHILDVIIVDEETGEVIGRPWGTALIDRFSRVLLSFEITFIPFSTPTLLKAMKIAMGEKENGLSGVFETLVVDNGSDYISSSLRYFCNKIGITIEYGSPRDPNSKAIVERFFKTLNTKLTHTLPGTTFSNPTDRGDYASEKYACMTLPDLKDIISEWVDTDYHTLIHEGHGRSPAKLWEESLKTNPVITYSQDDLEILARTVETCTISNGRVKRHYLQWYSHALATLEYDLRSKGIIPEVSVGVDETDLGHVYVQDPRDKYAVIRADSTTPQYADGLSLFEHKLIREELKKKGEKDIQHLGEYARQKARWKLWDKIVEYGERFSRKQLARLKESMKGKKKDINALKDLNKQNNLLCTDSPENEETSSIVDNTRKKHISTEHLENEHDTEYSFTRI